MAHRPPVADWLKDSGVFVHTSFPCQWGSSRRPGGRVEQRRAGRVPPLVAGVARSERLRGSARALRGAVCSRRRVASAGTWRVGSGDGRRSHGTDVSIHGREPAQRRLLSESLGLAAVTTVSHDHARLARHLFAREPRLVIPNFIDITRFKPTQSPIATGLASSRLELQAREDPRSLAQVFLAVRERIDAELWLVGDGPSCQLREMLRRPARRTRCAFSAPRPTSRRSCARPIYR